MFTHMEIEAIAQVLIDQYISAMGKEVAFKAANGAPEWELRYIAGKPVGAATFVTALMADLKKREEDNDA